MHEQRSSKQNRRVRVRTHGGVGGGVSNGSPYLIPLLLPESGVAFDRNTQTEIKLPEIPDFMRHEVTLHSLLSTN